MDLSYSEREEGFRRELREWLALNLPEHRKQYPPSDDELTFHPDKSFDASLAWARLWPRGEGRASLDPLLRQALAELYIEGRALRLMGLRYITRQLRGESPGPEGSVLKVAFTDTYKKMAEMATQILGLWSQPWRGAPGAPDGGRWAFQALFALRFGVAGGTTEIQKNIIGERLLGLPKG